MHAGSSVRVRQCVEWRSEPTSRPGDGDRTTDTSIYERHHVLDKPHQQRYQSDRSEQLYNNRREQCFLPEPSARRQFSR